MISLGLASITCSSDGRWRSATPPRKSHSAPRIAGKIAEDFLCPHRLARSETKSLATAWASIGNQRTNNPPNRIRYKPGAPLVEYLNEKSATASANADWSLLSYLVDAPRFVSGQPIAFLASFALGGLSNVVENNQRGILESVELKIVFRTSIHRSSDGYTTSPLRLFGLNPLLYCDLQDAMMQHTLVSICPGTRLFVFLTKHKMRL